MAEKEHRWSKRTIYFYRSWEEGLIEGLIEDPITGDPKEKNPINQKPKEDPIIVKPKDNPFN